MAGVLDGLPKQFVMAMRTLFDIMDDKRTGFVRFTEIERRWRDDGTKGLPKGVIESLRKVTPPNGLLSFERFCTGLKICLLRNQKNEGPPPEEKYTQQPVRPPSAPLLDTEGPKRVPAGWINTAGRSNYAHRTVSMPQLLSKELVPDQAEAVPHKPLLLGPPKPPRLGLGLAVGANLEKGIDKLEIRTALQNWQMGLMQADSRDKRPIGFGSLGRPGGRSLGDGKPAGQIEGAAATTHKKGGGRRREPRRHTLQNGIDYNMAVERARDWYLQQLSSLSDKMRFLGRDACYHSEQWSEAQTERLGMQRARVLEVNRQLAALTDPSVPLHMNLAVGGAGDSFMTRLKRQNHILTEELRKKSDHISNLEREKTALIRELFQVKSEHE
ncbi:hypothetical protein B566_EDAN003997 [Ephemera danica]|nr:hypothetical protein B566_EDAN003997 [Ephemera danica]